MPLKNFIFSLTKHPAFPLVGVMKLLGTWVKLVASVAEVVTLSVRTGK